MTKKELDRIFRENEAPSHGWEHLPPPPLESNEKPMHPALVCLIMLGILAFMISVCGCSTTDGTNQISAAWETVKARTEVGIGFKTDEQGIAFPIIMSWVAKPTPDDTKAERIEQTIVEGEPPFSSASKQPVAQ